ncbi:hypothetical protein ACQ86D_34375 [Streptomyces galilaeus]
MARVVDPSFTTEGSMLKVAFSVDESEEALSSLAVTLVAHDDIAANFFANGQCLRNGSNWEFEMSLESATSPRVIQLAKVVDERGELVEIGGPEIFVEPVSGGAWTSGDLARSELTKVEAAREARYSLTLKSADATAADPIFTAVALVDGLLITSILRVPGISVLKVTDPTLGSDGVEVLNSALRQLRFTSGISPTAWLADMGRRRPAVVLHMASIQAPNAEAASEKARTVAHQLLNLLALNRGSRGRIIGGAVGSPVGGAGEIRFSGSWIEGVDYAGNLMGGFISGESPHALLAQWSGASQDARLRLWLSLYSDALTDERWEYRLFRCFNLLEGIGKEALPANAPIVGSDGNPKLQVNGQPYTTRHAQGKVYELIRLVASVTNQMEANFTIGSTGMQGDLWGRVGVWTAVRNAVAHRGSWSIPEGETPDARHAQIEQEIKDLGADQTLDSGAWFLVRSIRNAAESTISAGLQQKI